MFSDAFFLASSSALARLSRISCAFALFSSELYGL